MRIVAPLWLCFTLAACGAGGGGTGVGSTPPPPVAAPAPPPSPPPPPLKNDVMAIDLAASQTFQTAAGSIDTILRLSDGGAVSSTSSRTPLTIQYDAATKTYTVAADGSSQVFGTEQRVGPNRAEEAVYVRPGQDGSEYLTLVATPYTSMTPNRYVNMGYWQRNSLVPGEQKTRFYIFAYGLDTPAAAMPRTGYASWVTDIFGLYTRPGEKTYVMEGTGRFEVDLGQGVFVTSGKISQRDVAGPGGFGSLDLLGGGKLTGNGRFAGHVSYSGASGILEGGFYGPDAQEMGASFHATSNFGTVLNGAMTGQRQPGATPSRNLILTNIVTEEMLLGSYAGLLVQRREGEALDVLYPERQNAGLVESPAGPQRLSLTFGGIEGLVRDEKQPRTNFTRYTGRTIAGATVKVDLYRAGSVNNELALSYTSFATWTQRTERLLYGGQKAVDDATYFAVYGIEPAPTIIAGMTGTGRYDGVAYGTGANMIGDRYQVGGTSNFVVDFSNKTYSGALNLTGTDSSGAVRQFGAFNFASTLNGSGFDFAWIGPPSDQGQVIRPRFFGHEAQEIGATFNVRTGNHLDPATVQIEGIAAAKRR